jgi:hypothetical protein
MIATFFFYIFVWMVITLALKKRKRKKFPWKNNTGEERVNSSDSLGVGFRV